MNTTITKATITTATVAAGLLGITMLAGTPAMAATACHNHNNPAACRARRDVHRMRQEAVEIAPVVGHPVMYDPNPSLVRGGSEAFVFLQSA